MSYYLGVDPGASGAIALVGHNGLIEVVDMPTHVITIGGKNRKRLDMHGLAQIIGQYGNIADNCVIEEVHSSPMDGAVGAFAFGEAFGAIKMAVAMAGIPYQLVKPQEWKKHHRLIGQDKDASRRRASELLPRNANLWSRKMDDGRAEAALIALYCAHINGEVK